MRPIAVLLLITQAAALSLSTGELHFDGASPAAGAFPGLFVLQIDVSVFKITNLAPYALASLQVR